MIRAKRFGSFSFFYHAMFAVNFFFFSSFGELPGLSRLVIASSVILAGLFLIRATFQDQSISVPWLAFLPWGFWLLALASILWSGYPDTSIGNLIMLTSRMFSATLILFCLENRISKKFFSKVVFITLCIFVFSLLREYFVYGHAVRVDGLGKNSNFAGITISVLMILFVLTSNNLFFTNVLLAVSGFAALTTGSRKVLVALAIIGLMALITTVTDLRKRGFSRTRSISPFILFAVISIFAWNTVLSETLPEWTVWKRTQYSLSGNYDSSTLTRMSMAEKAVQIFTDAPVIGEGLDTFRELSGFGTYSHSNYTEIPSGLRLAGLVVFHSLRLVILVKISFTSRIKDAASRILLNLTVCYLLVIDFGMVSCTSRPNLLLLFLLIYFIRHAPVPMKQRQEPQQYLQVQKEGIVHYEPCVCTF